MHFHLPTLALLSIGFLVGLALGFAWSHLVHMVKSDEAKTEDIIHGEITKATAAIEVLKADTHIEVKKLETDAVNVESSTTHVFKDLEAEVKAHAAETPKPKIPVG